MGTAAKSLQLRRNMIKVTKNSVLIPVLKNSTLLEFVHTHGFLEFICIMEIEFHIIFLQQKSNAVSYMATL